MQLMYNRLILISLLGNSFSYYYETVWAIATPQVCYLQLWWTSVSCFWLSHLLSRCHFVLLPWECDSIFQLAPWCWYHTHTQAIAVEWH